MDFMPTASIKVNEKLIMSVEVTQQNLEKLREQKGSKWYWLNTKSNNSTSDGVRRITDSERLCQCFAEHSNSSCSNIASQLEVFVQMNHFITTEWFELLNSFTLIRTVLKSCTCRNTGPILSVETPARQPQSSPLLYTFNYLLIFSLWDCFFPHCYLNLICLYENKGIEGLGKMCEWAMRESREGGT